jgi:flagellar hook-basal body complex protein FliE
MPIDPSFSVTTPDWNVGGVGALGGAGAVNQPAGSSSGGGFGAILSKSIEGLEKSQSTAATASQGLATGTVAPEDAVMAVERARLEMQLASTVRNKVVDSLNQVLHTQI